jgi:hypothetical protein
MNYLNVIYSILNTKKLAPEYLKCAIFKQSECLAFIT